MTLFSTAPNVQAQSPRHIISNTGGVKQQLSKSGSHTREVSGQQGVIPSNRYVVSESALPQMQLRDTAVDPVNQFGAFASATDIGGGGYRYSGGRSLDGKSSKSYSFNQKFHSEEISTAPLLSQSMSSAPIRRQESGSRQPRAGSTKVLTSSGADMGLQRSARAESYSKPTGPSQYSSQQAVQEALAASVSMAVSAGDEHVAEILKSMQGQMVRRKP